ncbi:MAG: hypothetical protein ABWK00_05830 [Desulfurococcaceae archaeon]
MSSVIEVELYLMEGCPHCERITRIIETCDALLVEGVRFRVLEALRGPIVRGYTGPTPMAKLGISAVPQIVIRARHGRRAAELVLIGGPGDASREEVCRTLAEAVRVVKAAVER